MRVLVVGSGAREHTILWKLAQSPSAPRLYSAPGNGGTGLIAENVAIGATEIDRLAEWALANAIDLTVVGPEDPLAAGLADRFRRVGLLVFGPTKDGARIEGSKAWAKELMNRYGVPTARSATFTSPTAAEEYVKSQPLPIVVKADGLAAGKGVVVATTHEQALAAISQLMRDKTTGSAGDRVVVEECLEGTEVSLLAFTDGSTVVPMVPACDYKRVFDDDQGPNTGGMGAYSPPRFVTRQMVEQIEETVLKPVVHGVAREGISYSGVLYAGLMITSNGPMVLEFNCRFGDPETQVILPRLKSDLLDVMLRTAEGRLGEIQVEWHDKPSCGVVLASGGYPGEFARGYPIAGLDSLDADALVFHAGTKRQGDDIVTSGGRVLTVVATGRDMREARQNAYRNAEKIRFTDIHYRKDIAAREL